MQLYYVECKNYCVAIWVVRKLWDYPKKGISKIVKGIFEEKIKEMKNMEKKIEEKKISIKENEGKMDIHPRKLRQGNYQLA